MPTPPTPYQDYIPGPDADFAAYVAAFAPLYAAGTLTVPDPTDVTAEAVAFGVAYAAAINGSTRGPATIAAKDSARATCEAIVRLAAQAMVQSYLNGDLTAQDLTDAGVRVPSTVQTPRLPPDVGPELVLRKITPGMVAFTIQQPEAAGYAKPIGCVGTIVFAGVWTEGGTVAPTSLASQGIFTRKRAIIDTSAFTGNLVLWVGKWVTVRGATSPSGAGVNVWAA